VTEAEWAAFLNEEVTPRFADGLSVLDVRGQYREPHGRIERERTKLLVVVVFDAPAHRPKVQAIVDAYSGATASTACSASSTRSAPAPSLCALIRAPPESIAGDDAALT
jgi:hypothetical protein